ncbi:MAG: putative hydrolase of the HAD superfamily [Flavobacterium sp.]
MIKVLMTDFDGVIRHWNNKKLFLFEKDNALEEGFLFSYAFRDEFLNPAMLGEITHEKWLENVRKGLKRNFRRNGRRELLANELIDHWQDSTFTLDFEPLDDYQRCFPDLPIVLASNATTLLNKDIENTNLPKRLSHIINSSEIGYIKPDLLFFESAFKALQCAADEVVFIDDQKINVEAANSLGIHGFHFTSRCTLANSFRGFCSG